MGTSEIKVVQAELAGALEEMKQILTEITRYRNRTALISEGYGEMAKAINELFEEMKNIEQVMDEVVEQTVEALNRAGVQFEQTDLTAAQAAAAIGSEINGT